MKIRAWVPDYVTSPSLLYHGPQKRIAYDRLDTLYDTRYFNLMGIIDIGELMVREGSSWRLVTASPRIISA